MEATRFGYSDIFSLLLGKGVDVNVKTNDGFTALMAAVEAGKVSMVEQLLKRGAEVNANSKNGVTALMLAVEAESPDMVKSLLKNGANANVKDKVGETILMKAADADSSEIVKLLLENGADVNAVSKDGQTAMSIAKVKEYDDIVAIIASHGGQTPEAQIISRSMDKVTRRGSELFARLKSGKIVSWSNTPKEGHWMGDFDAARGVNAKYEFKDYVNPWFIVAKFRWEDVETDFLNRNTGEMVSTCGLPELSPDKDRFFLFDNCDGMVIKKFSGARITNEYDYELSPEFHCKWSGPSTVEILLHKKVVAQLKRKGNTWELSGQIKLVRKESSNYYEQSSTGNDWPEWPVLCEHAWSGHLEGVKILLDKGADINVKCEGDETPINYAIGFGYWDVAMMFIKRGARTKADSLYTRTVLTKAAADGRLDMMRWALENGADINAEKGWPALHMAAVKGQLEAVKLLLAKGADVNLQDEHGRTALMSAAIAGHTEIVEALLDVGADVHVSDKDGWTALMDAAWGGRPEIVKLLFQKGANVKARNIYGGAAIIEATKSGNLGIVKMLIEKSADINTKTKASRTALKIAENHGFKDVARLLKEH
jgi:ankyrin repeat protein